MATRCSHRVKAYSMDQLRARSICLTSEGGMIEACYARMRLYYNNYYTIIININN